MSDPVIDEIRQVRHRISAKFGHDAARLINHYIKSQQRHGDRLLGSAKSNVRAGEPTA
jgi:hypothetical protein